MFKQSASPAIQPEAVEKSLNALSGLPHETLHAVVVRNQRRTIIAQKIIEVIGTPQESFAKAAENAVTESEKTVRGLKWARVAQLEMELDSKKIAQYRATTKIYFDIEK